MGWKNKFHCEWNPFGQKVLNHYWPAAETFTDITKSCFKKYNGTIDIISGGFPCQPYSQAGKRLGKEDDRHLWPEMLRAIREIQPGWVVGENVRGLTNWNGGMVFDEVQADLEAEGYEVLPFLLPACAVNAPHRRDRIWFIAYSHNARTNNGIRTNGNRAKENEGWEGQPQFEYREDGSNAATTHPESGRKGRLRIKGETTGPRKGNQPFGSVHRISSTTNPVSIGRNENEWRPYGKPNEYDKTCTPGTWENFPTQPPICGGDDGISTELVGITFSKHRNESIKGYGNAIVPNVAYQIFKAINKYNQL
jgi:DNA (cytosine-5)-methyltransferase 1